MTAISFLVTKAEACAAAPTTILSVAARSAMAAVVGLPSDCASRAMSGLSSL